MTNYLGIGVVTVLIFLLTFFNPATAVTIQSDLFATPQDSIPFGNTCQSGTTCESCVRINNINTQTDDSAETCMWEVTSSGRRCVEKHIPSQIVSQVAFNEQGCMVLSPNFTTSTATTTATTTTPEPVTSTPQSVISTPTTSSPRGDIFITEILSVAQKEMDELDYFGENSVRRIRKIQESNPKLASSVRDEIQKVLFENEELSKQIPLHFFLLRSSK